MKDADIYRLLSNFTHQVINPLNGVIGTLDNVVDGTINQKDIKQRINSARGQLECAVGLVRNLAYFAEYTAGNADARLKMDRTCVIPQLLIEALQFYQEQGKSRRIGIELLDSNPQWAVSGNPDLLRQVFMNIFDNAVKYGIPGNMVSVKYWQKMTPKQIIISISGKSVGFDTNEDIFALGFRGKAARDKTASGSGIGLSICKLIVENVFGGRIEKLFSPRTKIATFTIRIPGGFDNAKKI